MDNTKTDPDFAPDFEELENTYNLNDYPTYISLCSSYGLSPYQIANIANAFLVDLQIGDPTMFMNHEKARKLIERLGKVLKAQHDQTVGVEVIGFDGKRSDVQVSNGKMEKKEKITVICQQRRSYLHNFIPINGKGVTIANGLYEVLGTFSLIISQMICWLS